MFKRAIKFFFFVSIQPLFCQTNDTNQYKADWVAYNTNVEGKKSLIVLDLGLSKIAPIVAQKFIAWISVKLNEPVSDRILSENESTWMEDIKKGLTTNISSNFNSTFTGHQTYNGYREFYFYVNDTLGLNMVISETMNFYSAYKSKFGFSKDELWNGYFDYLYPDPETLQKIYNKKVVKGLEDGGDKLTKERLVDHWIYFKNKNDRAKFLSKIKDDKFNLVDENYNKELDKMPYSLHISRVDKVDYESVDSYIIPLWKLAKEHGGDYDGWETFIIKD